jgi:acid phosphatase (class A)
LTALAFVRGSPFRVIVALLALAGGAVTAVADTPPPPRYFDSTTLDLARLLPPAPANDSAETRADLDAMLKIQASRTPAESAHARADAQVSIYRLGDVLGIPAGFNEQSLPLTNAMFRKLLNSELSVVGAAKKDFARPRPFLLEPRLQPLLDKPGDPSYPSGHSSWIRAVALVLADMVPERRLQILERANEYARNRVVAGVHYPSDVEAGKLAGTAIAAALYANDDFRRDLESARPELRRALNLPPQTPPRVPAAVASPPQ